MDERAPGTVGVVLVDDEALVRAGLRMILGGADDIVVLAEAGDGQDALEVVGRHRPDVVLMDIRMPRLDGISACEQMVRRYADDVRVIVLTTFDTDDLVLRALRVGASGFLLKDTPPDRLVQAVRAVADGEPMLSPTITATLMSKVAAGGGEDDRGATARARLARLTQRERDVAIGVGEGLSNAADRPAALPERPHREGPRLARAAPSWRRPTASRSRSPSTTPVNGTETAPFRRRLWFGGNRSAPSIVIGCDAGVRRWGAPSRLRRKQCPRTPSSRVSTASCRRGSTPGSASRSSVSAARRLLTTRRPATRTARPPAAVTASRRRRGTRPSSPTVRPRRRTGGTARPRSPPARAAR